VNTSSFDNRLCAYEEEAAIMFPTLQSKTNHPKSQSRTRPSRLWFSLAVAALGLVLLGGERPSASTPPTTPSTPQPMAKAAAPSATPASPMDEPIRLITEARKAYQNVRDYTCLLVKRERINGVMPAADSVMDMRVRVQPFSVYLRWMQPRTDAGQEVCYVAGRNDGKMRVHPKGVLGAVGFVSMDVDDPRAKQTSRRNISEAGIGNLIERFAKGWEIERRLNVTQVSVAEYEYNRRRCTRVETIHPTNPEGKFHYYRTLLYFDKETHLPIRLECYDWPRRQGETGDLVEVYSFANMRLNVGLSDKVFNH
jgi:hypothetical protein